MRAVAVFQNELSHRIHKVSNPAWQISVLERVTLNYEWLGSLSSPFTSVDRGVQNLLTAPWLNDKALRMYGRKHVNDIAKTIKRISLRQRRSIYPPADNGDLAC